MVTESELNAIIDEALDTTEATEETIETQEENTNLIPENSDTLQIDESTIRFSSAVWYKEIQKQEILLAGIGGIGSYVGFLLARMKPKSLIIMDDDVVDITNMSGQLYSIMDLNTFKTDALNSFIKNYAGYYDTFSINEKFTEDTPVKDIMICGFDNMIARKTFFNKWQEHVNNLSEDKRKGCLFIDGRLAAEEFQVLCIKGDDVYNRCRYSKEFLFSDEEADATICSYKQTSFCANMIASVIVNLFVNFVANQCNVVIDRDLPFYTEYNAERMFFKTEA